MVDKKPQKKPTKTATKKKTTPKAIKSLLAKGKKQGYLTYDEINELLPEDMLFPEQIDETLMLFYANNIEIIEEKHQKKVVKLKKAKEKKLLRAWPNTILKSLPVITARVFPPFKK